MLTVTRDFSLKLKSAFKKDFRKPRKSGRQLLTNATKSADSGSGNCFKQHQKDHESGANKNTHCTAMDTLSIYSHKLSGQHTPLHIWSLKSAALPFVPHSSAALGNVMKSHSHSKEAVGKLEMYDFSMKVPFHTFV